MVLNRYKWQIPTIEKSVITKGEPGNLRISVRGRSRRGWYASYSLIHPATNNAYLVGMRGDFEEIPP